MKLKALIPKTPMLKAPKHMAKISFGGFGKTVTIREAIIMAALVEHCKCCLPKWTRGYSRMAVA